MTCNDRSADQKADRTSLDSPLSKVAGNRSGRPSYRLTVLSILIGICWLCWPSLGMTQSWRPQATPPFGNSNAQQGAWRGGAAGAIVGGIAGHQNGETVEGIAIGTVLGALVGSAIGRDEDRLTAQRNQYLQYQQQLQQQQRANALRLADVITLARSGISDDLMISQIRRQGVREPIGVNQIVSLHQNGVSERVIQAMQSAYVGGSNGGPFGGSSGLANPNRYPYPASPQVYSIPPERTIVVQPQPVYVVPYGGPPRHWHPHRPYYQGAHPATRHRAYNSGLQLDFYYR